LVRDWSVSRWEKSWRRPVREVSHHLAIHGFSRLMTESPPDSSAGGPDFSGPRGVGAGDGGFQVAALPVDARLGWMALGLSALSTLVYLATSHALWIWLEHLTGSVRKVLEMFP
jgi:hypothetical protein